MVSKLVIVESPAKAKTINRYLGREYKVIASMGHIRDLPENVLGIDVKDNFRPTYLESTRKNKVLSDLRTAARTAKEIYLAPDPDREGEAIAWHLHEVLLPIAPKAQFYRVAFHEITHSAITHAFSHAGEINMNLVNAQQARRVLDRLVGYQVSPLLWSSVERGRGISAGRVQSVALRLVVEREREIENFKPEEYWNLWVNLEAETTGSGKVFCSRFFRYENAKEKATIPNEQTAQVILKAVKDKPQKVVTSELEPRKRYPNPPFITSTLQQMSGSLLRNTSKQTMQIAQELYEGIDIGNDGPVGLITYMRTDSFNIAAEAQKACLGYIRQVYGEAYVPPKPNTYRSKANAQEAPEAIRPTDVTLTPERVKKFLTPMQYRLYNLIWKRFVTSQMAPAQQQRATLETQVENTPYIFRTVATETLFPGYLLLVSDEEKEAKNAGLGNMSPDDDEQFVSIRFLNDLKKGDTVFYIDQGGEQKFTEPPPRYSEATLVRALETNGVGRPSTYASIVSTIQDRAYVAREKGHLLPTELGTRVNDYLVAHLDELFQINFTANMEKRLDDIEDGMVNWVDMLHDFYDHSFTSWLEKAIYHDSPEPKRVEALIKEFDNVHEWIEPTARGGRAYSDKRFMSSIASQFAKNEKITGKQYQALLRLANIYSEQLPNLDALAKQYHFTDDLNATRKLYENPPESESEKVEAERVSQEITELFAKLENVQFEKPTTNGKRVYDDGKFVESLKIQLKKKKPLSDKQLSAVRRIVEKYERLENPKAEEAVAVAQANVEVKRNPAVDHCIELLDQITTFDAPVKKGTRTYNDGDFYASIKTQYAAGKELSSRQVAALEKMAARYAAKVGDKSFAPEVHVQAAPEKTDGAKIDPAPFFAQLDQVTTWEKGHGRFNDQTFYNSLKRQHTQGKQLSDKQIAALQRLANKYLVKD